MLGVNFERRGGGVGCRGGIWSFSVLGDEGLKRCGDFQLEVEESKFDFGNPLARWKEIYLYGPRLSLTHYSVSSWDM